MQADKQILFIFLFIFTFCYKATAEGIFSSKLNKDVEIDHTKPILGFGPGLLTFFGDVGTKNLQGPFKHKLGYHMTLEKNLTNNFNASINLLFGNIYGEEKLSDKNLNFKSTIISQGINFTYYYNKKKDTNRIPFFSPFISIGVGLIYFRPMGDLRNGQGDYYYWKNGSIKNKPEPDTTAIILQRDYSYETDLRKANIDGLGNYSLITPQIPLSLGTQINISNRFSLKIGATYYYTFSDNIDNVSGKSINNHPIYGNRKGDKFKDSYIHSSLTLIYDLSTPKYQKTYEVDDAGLIVLDIKDSDKDGVVDMHDECPGTPRGITVDKHGCPPDDDNDGVPNYLDKDPKTRKGVLVNLYGEEIKEGSGVMPPLKYASFVSEGDTSFIRDSVYKFEPIAEEFQDTSKTEIISGIEDLASDTGLVLNEEEQNSIEDNKDTSSASDTLQQDITLNLDDTTHIAEEEIATAQNDNSNEKNIETENTNIEKIDTSKTIPSYTDTNKFATDVQETKQDQTNKEIIKESTTFADDTTSEKTVQLPEGVIYRVQVGTFKKEVPLEKVNALLNLEGITKETSPEGLSIFNVGIFRTFESAEEVRKIAIKSGIEDAFVVAYKDAVKISVPEAKLITKPIISKGDTLVVEEVKGKEKVTIINITEKDTALLITKKAKLTSEINKKIEHSVEIKQGNTYIVKNTTNRDTIVLESTVNKQDTSLIYKADNTKDDFNEGDTIVVNLIGNEDSVTFSNITQKDTVIAMKIPVISSYMLPGDFQGISMDSELKKGDTLFVSNVSEKDSSTVVKISKDDTTTFTSIVIEKPTKEEEKKVIELIKQIEATEEIKPTKIEEKGLVYKVQIGAFRYAVPLDLFNLFMKLNIKNVEYKFYPVDSLTRYTSGNYNNYKDALKAKQEIISKGITDAFLVAFKDGQRITFGESMAISSKNIETSFASADTTSDLSLIKSDNLNDNNLESFIKGLIFKVQIGAYLYDVPIDLFQSIEAVTTEKGPNGLTRYTAGVFRSSEAVEIFKNAAILKGFKDAFIVTYNDGKKIDIDNALKIITKYEKKEKEEYDAIKNIELEELENLNIFKDENTNIVQNSVKEANDKGIIFKVQVGVFKQGVPPNLWDIYQTIEDLSNYFTSDGLKIYTTGKFNNYEEAVKHKQKIIEKGISDAFIVAYIDERMVSVQEARLLIKQ